MRRKNKIDIQESGALIQEGLTPFLWKLLYKRAGLLKTSI
jgi:hypothetical protein